MQRKEGAFDNDAFKSHAQLIQQTAEECDADVSEAQILLDELHAKITAPT